MRPAYRTAVFLACLCSVRAYCQQMADPNFDAHVANPAYPSRHPRVVIDEAHHNFHTADGRYKPFASLLRSDGYQVVRGEKAFSAAGLGGTAVLVVANALGPGANAGTDTSPAAFTESECAAVRDWVRGGGSLLLIADHTPFGTAADPLANAIGVQMGKGFVFSLDAKYRSGNPTTLVFSRSNGLLGDHPITRGRTADERIETVVAFTGQSLSVPAGATALMKLSADAQEASSRSELGAAVRNQEHAKPATGAQGIAMPFGKGRIVVLGEAALMSAQVIREAGQPDLKMGMNAPGSDDRQFALNVLHWLSRLIE